MDMYSGFTPLQQTLQREMHGTAYANDNDFGPILKLPGQKTFDFTLLFEETIFSIGPSVLLLFLIPPRIIHLWKSPRKVINSYLLKIKMVSLQAYS